jgi:hypothetical protein
MYKIKSIGIPTPCHQSWQQMEPKEHGRYCTSCTKIVIDFTRMTNAEILDYLAGAKDVCGRVNEHQLYSINHQLAPKKAPGPFTWKRWLVAAGLLGAGFFNKADAQVKTTITAVQQQPVSKSYSLSKGVRHSKAYRHSNKKAKTLLAKTSDIRDDKVDLVAYRADIRSVKQLPEPVCAIGLNVSTELEGMLGGVVAGVEVYTPSRVEMFYQYMPWPINKLFK